uniref:RibD_C domain-containing protein n=1 Tax=Macrostomum lignano TaxID=282301 RepID=A0A1I8JRC2_9PLAT
LRMDFSEVPDREEAAASAPHLLLLELLEPHQRAAASDALNDEGCSGLALQLASGATAASVHGTQLTNRRKSRSPDSGRGGNSSKARRATSILWESTSPRRRRSLFPQRRNPFAMTDDSPTTAGDNSGFRDRRERSSSRRSQQRHHSHHHHQQHRKSTAAQQQKPAEAPQTSRRSSSRRPSAAQGGPAGGGRDALIRSTWSASRFPTRRARRRRGFHEPAADADSCRRDFVDHRRAMVVGDATVIGKGPTLAEYGRDSLRPGFPVPAAAQQAATLLASHPNGSLLANSAACPARIGH